MLNTYIKNRGITQTLVNNNNQKQEWDMFVQCAGDITEQNKPVFLRPTAKALRNQWCNIVVCTEATIHRKQYNQEVRQLGQATLVR